MAGSVVRTVFLLLSALLVMSQQPAEGQTLTGSAFAGVGAFACCSGATSAFEVGAGLERAVTPHVSIDGEFGVAVPAGNGRIVQRSAEWTNTMDFNTGAFGSFNVFYHIDRDSRRLRPFVTGGFGCVGSCLIAGPSFGAGSDLWLRDGGGVRVEVRDQLMGEFGITHLITVRIGWVFRPRT